MALLLVCGRGEYPLCLQQTVERGELTVRGEGSQLSGDPEGRERRREREERGEREKHQVRVSLLSTLHGENGLGLAHLMSSLPLVMDAV